MQARTQGGGLVGLNTTFVTANHQNETFVLKSPPQNYFPGTPLLYLLTCCWVDVVVVDGIRIGFVVILRETLRGRSLNKDNMWEIDLVALGGRRENEEGFGAGGLLIILQEKIVSIGGPNERGKMIARMMAAAAQF